MPCVKSDLVCVKRCRSPSKYQKGMKGFFVYSFSSAVLNADTIALLFLLKIKQDSTFWIFMLSQSATTFYPHDNVLLK